VDPTLLGDATARVPDRIAAALANVDSTEDFLDRMRDIAAEELFLVGVRTLAITEDGDEVERARTDVADALIRAALDRVLADFAAQHGRVPGGGCVVLGLGKLGSGELTATSDLDLMVIYRVDPAGPDSDGARPLDPTTYYARVTQRLIASLTVPTRRGRLYDVDVRLRPSGRQGPVAIRFSAFTAYQDSEAQTWEHMALTRARIVAGDPDLAHDVEVEIARILGRSRDLSVLQRDVGTMRTLVAGEKPARDVWDFKLAAGGLLDIEFAAQYLQLAFAHRHPALCQRHPLLVLAEAVRLGLDEPARLTAFRDAYQLQGRLAQIVRLLVGEPASVDRLGAGGMRRLCEAAHQPGPSQLEALLTDVRASVRAHLEDMLDRRI
jgi:[glutamine synthetase] adenylyltransferase / [glutamine synthetase]-adenylyl-L-tyrosine phosphorylase